MASILDILSRLDAAGVEFVIVGGMAGVAHGSAMVTEDLDLCADLNDEQMKRIHGVMCELDGRWRMLPGRPAIPAEWKAWRGFRNLYIETSLGQVDVLSEIAGLGAYDEVCRRAVTMNVAGGAYRVLDLDALIEAKRALGRGKDIQAATELEGIRERMRGGAGDG